MSLNLRSPLSVILLLLSCVTASALNISGIVKDKSANEPLIEATVQLLSSKDSSFVKGVTTNNSGSFTLKDVKKGKYILKVSYIGYHDFFKDINAESGTNVRLGALEMNEASELLKEVEVVAVKTPIRVAEDTVEYNADSYHTQPNAVVEDLLKRLPGVEVDSDGKITAHGKSISKILVNGKEFFSDDPQVASRNLPADMIDKLQVVDRKSDMARLTGVDDGDDETVINLTVKKGRENGWFGNAEAGYGTDSRYQANFNINHFKNGNQITLLGNLNNVNRIGFNDGSNSRFRGGRSGGITISRALGLNFNVGNGEILRVGGDVIFSNTDRNSQSRSERQYIFTDSTSYSHVRNIGKSRSSNLNANFRLQWKPDSFNTMEFRPQFSFGHKNGFTADTTLNSSGLRELVSSDVNYANNRGNSYDISGRLIYSHNFRKHRGRSFSISGEYSLSDTKERGTSLSEIYFQLLDSAYILDEYDRNHTWSNRVNSRVTWNEPIGNVANGNFLVFSYSMNYRWNNADKLTFDHPVFYPEVGDPIVDYDNLVFNDSLSNQYRNSTFDQNIRLGYKKAGSALTYEVGLSLIPQMTKSINYLNSDKNINRWVWNYAPFLRLRYKFSKQRSLQANYRGRSSQPSMSQLQPVPDYSNPMNIKIGNPNLDPSFTHNINLRYNDYSQEKQRSLMFSGDFSFTQNSIVSKTRYDNETSQRYTEYLNVNGAWNARLMNMMSMPLGNKKWTISNQIFGNASQNVGFYSVGKKDAVKNFAREFSVFESPGIAFRPDNFEFELRPNYRLQLSTNTVQKTSDRTIHAYGGRADATYYTPWGLTLQSDVNYSATSGYASGYNTKTWRWNASISQQFLRNKALTLTVSAYDLLGQVSNISRSINANYISDSWTNTLTRYFMFSLSYKFNSFGKGNEPRREGMEGEGGGRRGPGGFGGRGGMGGGRRGGL